jgi:hypothetical protein
MSNLNIYKITFHIQTIYYSGLKQNNKMPRQNESGSRRALPESCLRSPNTRGTSEEHLS